MMFRALYVLSVMVTSAACSNHSLTKRHLNWKDEQGYRIKSSSNEVEDIVVNNLSPHHKNVKIMDDKVYVSFVLYIKEGEREGKPNGGVFHFVDAEKAYNRKMDCPKTQTNHSGAYVSVYEKCPDEDKYLVASGYCYDKGILGFKSGTFNQKSRVYTDTRYYLNDDVVVHEIEQRLLTCCFEDWKNNGFTTDSNWSCKFGNVAMEQCMAKVPLPNLNECNSCDEPCPSSAASLFNYGNEIAGCVVMLLSVSWNLYKALLN